MRATKFILAALLIAAWPATFAQAQVKGGVVMIPPITPNDCAAWVSTNILKDSGGPCGGGGIGNVIGPASSTDGAVALYDGTTGKLLKDGLSPNITISGTSVNLGGSITETTQLDSIGSVSGDILYRNGTVWTVLPKAADGNFLSLASGFPAWVASLGGGTVTSITCGNGLNCASSNPITTSGTISNTTTLNTQTGTSYATASTDGGKTITLVNAGAIAVSLVQANTANFTSGFGTTYANIGKTTGSGLVTVTAATSVFGNGLTTLKVYPGGVCDVASDSTNYSFTACSMPLLANNGIIANTSGATNYGIPTTSTNITTLLATNPLVALTGAATSGHCAQFSGTAGLVADSGAACGGSSYTNGERAVVSGRYYWADKYPAFATGAVFAITAMYARSVYIPNDITIQSIGAELNTAAAGGNCQFAVYASASGRPTGAVIAQTGNISTTTAANVTGAVTPVLLSGNTIYFFAAMCDNTTAQFKVPSFSNDSWDGYRVGVATVGSLISSTTTVMTRFIVTGQTFGTFPTSPTMTELSTNGANNSVPAFFFQAS